ncbi:MAG: ABC transporter substrate-binding protein [Actinobacteria bacterium]|nr:ABC transporter substrate-binding protein [Actinomycetota bacterium]
MSIVDRELSRRKLLQAGAAGAAAIAAADLLAACGGGSTSSSGSATGSAVTIGEPTAGGGKPVRGGTYNVGMISGGTAETLNPAFIISYPDFFRGYQLYDLLFELDENAKIKGGLATSAEPNKDSTEWVLKLRDGVTWHDGQPFNADDVVYNFKLWSSPENFGHYSIAGLVDFKGVKKSGPLEVTVPLTQPVGDFASLFASFTNFVSQDGATASSFKTNPVGTGPYKYVSFDPGKQSVFEWNTSYWEEGKPYVEKMIVDSSFTDESSRLNALLAGKINVLPLMPFNEARGQAENGSVKVLSSPGLGTYQIAMAVDMAPFDDAKVRQAMSLLCDRQAMIDGALSGLGEVGNNLFGGFPETHVPYYATDLKAEYDPEKAKALLKSAGKEGLSFDMPIAEAGPGYVESATLFAQQAKAAGVNVNLQNIPTGEYFLVKPGGYLSRPIQVSASIPYASLTAWYRAYLTSGSPTGETHWGSPAHDKEINRAIAATDPAKAAEAWHSVQETQLNEGGELIFAYPNWVDCVASNISGLKEAPCNYLNNVRMLDGWIGK